MGGSVTALSVLLLILNVIQLLLGFVLSAASIWFFIEVQGITSMRNVNYNLLDYNIYWLQVIPWIFLAVAVFVLCVSCCGFAGARTKSKGFVLTFVTFEVIAVLILITATVITLVYVDSEKTDEFIKITLVDAFNNFNNNINQKNKGVAEAFADIEIRLGCCGNVNPQEYKKWRGNFPISCCNTDANTFISTKQCEFSNDLAYEKHGCLPVVTKYAKIGINALAVMSAFMAFIGVLNLVAAVAVSAGLKKKKTLRVKQEQSEIKKVMP